MNRSVFCKLVKILRPSLERNRTMGALRNGAIEPEVRLAIVLRILSGASYHDMMLLWSIACSTVYVIFQETVDAILEHSRSATFQQRKRSVLNCSDVCFFVKDDESTSWLYWCLIWHCSVRVAIFCLVCRTLLPIHQQYHADSVCVCVERHVCRCCGHCRLASVFHCFSRHGSNRILQQVLPLI